MMKFNLNKRASLINTLICLTVLFIVAQGTLFILHYKITDIIDSLVNTSISFGFAYPVVWLPILGFLALQFLAYGLLIAWIWFIAVSLAEYFKLSTNAKYRIGILCWCFACIAILALNHYYFPDSFFSKLIVQNPFLKTMSPILLWVTLLTLLAATLIAYLNFFQFKRYRKVGTGLLVLGFSYAAFSFYDMMQVSFLMPPKGAQDNVKPNIILIGLDSLRPDFTGYFGHQTIHTPYVDNFLNTSAAFGNAYTPLGRTFPAWVSILTAQYPKHNHARNNLVDPKRVIENDTIAKRLRQEGYETIYATDEKRFSNITTEYGFDRVIGPQMGVNDFLLGGLSDFPLTNLLVNLPLGQYLFPFNFGNRAAAITYEPNKFLRLMKLGLRNRSTKPLFLSAHLCLSHWPFTWARDGQSRNLILPEQYRSSVEAVDLQFGKLLGILKENGLLENSIVVLLSDHGTGVGLPGDRFISEKTYMGDPKQLNLIAVNKLSTAPAQSTDKRDYTINTAYGQGTNVLSLKQYNVILAFKRYGGETWPVRRIDTPSMLVDIAPTLLDLMGLPPMQAIDGVSLRKSLSNGSMSKSRPLFMETGDSMTEIETDHIYIEKVIKHEIGIYHIDPTRGLLVMDPKAEQSIVKNKQLAVLMGDWMLAHYPAHMQAKLVTSKKPGSAQPQSEASMVPPYYVLANLKTGKWTIGVTSDFAKTAPLEELMRKLKDFYGDEL